MGVAVVFAAVAAALSARLPSLVQPLKLLLLLSRREGQRPKTAEGERERKEAVTFFIPKRKEGRRGGSKILGPARSLFCRCWKQRLWYLSLSRAFCSGLSCPALSQRTRRADRSLEAFSGL